MMEIDNQDDEGGASPADDDVGVELDRIVDRYFAAMRQGASAEAEMLSLFCEDATYSEPFSGLEPAIGLAAIRQRFRHGWEQPLADMELDVLEVEVSPGNARSRWECRSPALPGPVQGEDHYEFRDGRISRLEVRFLADRD
jgi:hypothetical protein